MQPDRTLLQSKVPEANAPFWILKLLATTLDEVGGNLISMNLGLGYLQATAILFGLFAALAAMQIGARRYHPLLYWTTIVASTTAGTTLADYVTRSIGMDTLAARCSCWRSSCCRCSRGALRSAESPPTT